MFPKYNQLLNKPKLSLYEINKFKNNVSKEQINTHNILITVNKHNIKKGLYLQEMKDKDDIT